MGKKLDKIHAGIGTRQKRQTCTSSKQRHLEKILVPWKRPSADVMKRLVRTDKHTPGEKTNRVNLWGEKEKEGSVRSPGGMERYRTHTDPT